MYGVALAWLYEDLPSSHEFRWAIGGNSLGNVMEGLLGIMWAEVNLKNCDFESFRRLVHSQEMQCLDDAVEDAWRFLKSMQPGLAAWEPFLLSYIRSVNTILEVHSDFFWPIT